MAPDDIVARTELRQLVVAEMLRLEEPFRGTLLMRFFEGLEPIEIARRDGIPPGTVRSRLKEGLDRLRARLDGLHRGSRGAWVAPLVTLLRPYEAPTLVSTSALLVSAAASVVTTGGFVMAYKTIVGVVCVILLAGVWLWLRPPDPPADGPPARTREFAVRAEAPSEVPPDIDGDQLPLPVDLAAADRDHDLHGRVTDANGESVAGAALTLLTYPWRRTGVLNHDGDSRPEAAQARTAVDGTFSFRLRRGSLVDLHVQAAGFVPQTIPSAQAGERLDIRLLRGGVDLTVEVLGEDGGAIEGATVSVFTHWLEPAAMVPVSGISDVEGRARIPGVTPSLSLRVDVWKSGLGDPAWVPFTTPASGAHTVTIRLPRGRELRGTITDAATGRPVADASIGMGRDQQDAVCSGPDGTWRLPGWTGASRRQVAITAPGYGRVHMTVGDRQVIDVSLEPGDTVVGRLVDASGKVIEGARVTAISSPLSFGHDTSDGEGRYRVTSLRHDMVHTLVVFAEGHGRTMIDFSPHPGGPGTVDLGNVHVHAGHSIEGIVRDADGDPVPWMAVTLLGANADRNRLRNLPSPDLSHCESERRRTDDLGRFCFPDLAPGTYTITAEPPRAPHRSTHVRIIASDVLDAEVRLSRGRRVTVTVLGPDDVPLPGVMVVAAAIGSDALPVNGRTDANGTCTLTIEFSGRVHLAAWGRGSLPAGLVGPPARILGPDETTATFRFGRGALVRARVLDGDGDPVRGLQVEIHSGKAPPLFATTNDEGRTARRLPSANPVDLIVTGDVQSSFHAGRLPLRGEARGVRPNEGEVTIHCRAVVHDRTLTVRVADPDGRPMEGIRVWIWNSDSRDPKRVSGADGMVRLTGLPPEESRLGAFPASGRLQRDWFPPTPLRVAPDGQTVEMRFRRGVEVTGILMDRGGVGIVAAHVSARLGDQVLSRGKTEAGGHFTLFVPETVARFDITAEWNTTDAGVGRVSLADVTPGRDIRLIAD